MQHWSLGNNPAVVCIHTHLQLRISGLRCHVTSCETAPPNSTRSVRLSSAKMCSSVLARVVGFGAVFLVLVHPSSCRLALPATATTRIPAVANSSWTMASPQNSSATAVSAHGINTVLHSTTAGHGALQEASSAPTTIAVKNASVAKLTHSPSKGTPSSHPHQSSPKTSANVTRTSTVKPAMPATTSEVAATTGESVIGSPWDGWKQLLTRNYWKKRIYDTHYLMELLIPIAFGAALCLVLVAVFSIFRCLILQRHKRKNKSRLDLHNRENLSDNTWMLLENSDSEEDVV